MYLSSQPAFVRDRRDGWRLIFANMFYHNVNISFHIFIFAASVSLRPARSCERQEGWLEVGICKYSLLFVNVSLHIFIFVASVSLRPAGSCERQERRIRVETQVSRKCLQIFVSFSRYFVLYFHIL